MKLDNVPSFPLYFEGLIRPIYKGLNLSFHLAEKNVFFSNLNITTQVMGRPISLMTGPVQ